MGEGGGGFDLKNQGLGFELGRKKHLLSQEKLQLASLAFVLNCNLKQYKYHKIKKYFKKSKKYIKFPNIFSALL